MKKVRKLQIQTTLREKAFSIKDEKKSKNYVEEEGDKKDRSQKMVHL